MVAIYIIYSEVIFVFLYVFLAQPPALDDIVYSFGKLQCKPFAVYTGWKHYTQSTHQLCILSYPF